MKNKDIVQLYNFLNSEKVGKIKGYSKFQFVAVRNIKLLQDEIDSINSILKEYNKEIGECYKKYSIKDEEGSPKVINDNIKVDPEKEKEFRAEIKSINEKYKEAIDTYESVLEEEYKGELKTITIDDIEGIELDTKDFYIIDLIIKE